MAENNLGWLGGALGGLGSVLGAGINAGIQNKINKENMKLQKEFAQNGIQWRVQDAQKAGIHPAVALGAQTYQASPSSVAPDVGSGVSGAFKHFGSAIDSFIDDKEEERDLQLQNMRLQNQKEELEIKKMKESGLNPLPNTSPSPAPNVSNDIKGAKKVVKDEIPLGVSAGYGKDMSVSVSGNGDIVLTYKQDGTLGSSHSEAMLFGPTNVYHTDQLRDEAYRLYNQTVASARARGILKPDETYEVQTSGKSIRFKKIKEKDYPYQKGVKPSYFDELEHWLRTTFGIPKKK